MARILVLNPTLGTGGGSRWSLQAAESLAARGHEVDWVAGAPKQASPAWPELSTASFRRHLVKVRRPETVAGRARAVCSTLRTLSLLRWCRAQDFEPDAILLDSVPFVLERARAEFPRSRLVFYCHFPEVLYAKATPWFLRWHRSYWVMRERRGLAAADQVLVNGTYTHQRLLAVFPELAGRVSICHPAVRWQAAAVVPEEPRHLLCVARWDPEKNLPLAVRAYAVYRRRLDAAGRGGQALPLVIAGGFDAAWRGAHETFAAVEREQASLGLPVEACRFLRNPGDVELDALYRGALVLVHPAPHEHFGMVAPEAMLRGVPVVGIGGSGLADSVVEGETGFLVAVDAERMGERLEQLQLDPVLRRRFGAQARLRVEGGFLTGHAGAKLEAALCGA